MPKIPEYRFEIPEAVLGLHMFCFNTKSEGRKAPHAGLDHICIEPDPPSKRGQDRLIHAVASDGHQLAHLQWISDPEKDVIPDGVILIPASQAKEFLTGRRPKDTRYWIEGEDWKVIGDNGTRMPIEDTAGSYTDQWKDIIPSREQAAMAHTKRKKENTPPLTELGLNWGLMETFAQFSKKYMNRLGFKMVLPEHGIGPVLMIPVNLEGYDENRMAVELEYLLNDGITEMEYILMPLRV